MSRDNFKRSTDNVVSRFLHVVKPKLSPSVELRIGSQANSILVLFPTFCSVPVWVEEAIDKCQ